MHKPFGYVFETRWHTQADSRRRRKPLSIASALARNGENPTAICQNADSTPLAYDKPLTLEDARTLITSQYTPQTWGAMTQKRRKASELGPQQLGLLAIATLFGIDGNPVRNHADHLALGRVIWAEAWVEPETLDAAGIRPLITSQFTPESWVAMKQKEKQAIKLGPQQLGLYAIATLFGIDGNPVRNHADHLALGRAIWAEAWVEPETLMPLGFAPHHLAVYPGSRGWR
jgi:hypothetical protein